MDAAKWTRRYSARTLQELDVLRSFGRWTDVTLQAFPDGEQFPAHRCVLASASPYFAAMLGNENFSEAGQDTITLHEITEEGLRGLLKFVYSGCIDLTAENIRQILKAASITQVPSSAWVLRLNPVVLITVFLVVGVRADGRLPEDLENLAGL